MFIGRKEELKEIKEALDSSKMESILVYGRRRIGKTDLVNESLKNYKKRILSFECKKVSNKFNLDLLTKTLISTFNLPSIQFENFNDFFDYIFNLSLNEEFVFVLDEFTFLLEEDPSIESFLASAIDKYKRNSKIKLFILGSYVNLIEKMVEKSSHSYGRFTHIILLRPFNYYDSSLFYENYSDEDKIIIYSVFGGVPYFNSLINTQKSALENICDLIIKRDSIFEKEIENIILNETKKIPELNELLAIISSGVTKYSDIIKLTSFQIKNPDYLLKKLIDMNIILKEVPINDKNNKKRTIYKLKDNLLCFYYRYIFSTNLNIFRDKPLFLFENFIKDNFFKEYIPLKFEEISKEFLIRENLKYKINPIFEDIGTYSFNDKKNKINRQFDIVTKDKLGFISYECKYTNEKIGLKEINEELEQTQNLEINFYKLGFISKNGFKTSVDKSKYNLFSLDEFYKN